jgi:hypothetical protein
MEMNVLKHATQQPFIAATGAAALVHSTWALAVLFSGEPPGWDHTSVVSWLQWAYWLIPALLISFALDVGQIATSAEIRNGERTRTKYATFVVFALATYYLQWLYIAHHMPALQLGEGVYADGFAGRIVLMTRNAAIWFIPALLPLSTTMYTLSGGSQHHVTKHDSQQIIIADERGDLLPDQVPGADESDHNAECPSCGWQRTYDNADSARRGLAAHQSRCPALHPELVERYNGNQE